MVNAPTLTSAVVRLRLTLQHIRENASTADYLAAFSLCEAAQWCPPGQPRGYEPLRQPRVWPDAHSKVPGAFPVNLGPRTHLRGPFHAPRRRAANQEKPSLANSTLKLR